MSNKNQMTSQERIIAAINHKEVDKLPIDLGATPSSGISAIAYNNLIKHLGKNDLDVNIYDVVQQLAQPDYSILDLFGIDVIDIGRVYNVEKKYWKPTVLSSNSSFLYPYWFNPVQLNDGSFATFDDDGKTMLSRMPVGATFFDQTYFPYVDGYPVSYENLDEEINKVMWARHVHSPWDFIKDNNFWYDLRERVISLRKTTDKALLIVCGCNLFEWGTFLRRIDNFLMDLLCDTYNVEKLLDELLKRHLIMLEKVCTAVGDIVDIIRFGDDLGMSSGSFMEKDTYKKMFKSRHKMLCDYVKKNSKMHTFLHSCGSISLLLPELIEAGFEIFNPVQTNSYNMKPEFLKKEFGKYCTFWGGGIENVGILNNGSSQQVAEQVLERLHIFSEGGGYVFNTIHNILPDVPPENIVTMFETVKNFNNIIK